MDENLVVGLTPIMYHKNTDSATSEESFPQIKVEAVNNYCTDASGTPVEKPVQWEDATAEQIAEEREKGNAPETPTIDTPEAVKTTADGLTWSYNLVDRSLRFTANDKTSVIPSFTSSSYKNSDWFKYAETATSIEFYGITEIGNNAFWNFTAITKISGDDVASIGEGSFDSCLSLSSVDFPALTTIGDYAFNDCSALASITSENVTSIGYRAFKECVSLAYFDFDGVSKVGGAAFINCSSLAAEIDGFVNATIGDSAFSGSGIVGADLKGVTSLDRNAFKDCTELVEVTGLDGLSIGANTFKNTAITQIDISGITGKEIGNEAFYGSKITSVIIPSQIETIGDYAFQNCTELKTVVIANGVKTIGQEAFRGCTALETISVPASVEEIDYYAFTDAAREGTISIDPENPHYSTDASGKMIYDRSEGTSTLFMMLGGVTDFVIPVDATAIATGAFYGNESIESVDFSQNELIDTIPMNAFKDCSNLSSVTFSEHIKTIGDDAFSFTGLESVTIPGNITTIDSNAFQECFSLTSVIFESGDSPVSLGTYIFKNCTALENVTMPGNLASVPRYTFYGCSSLTTVDFGDGSQVATIEAYAFGDCTALRGINLPDSLKTIRGNAFVGSGLKSIVIPGGTSADAFAFDNCDDLDLIVAGVGVKMEEPVFKKSSMTPTSIVLLGDTTYDAGSDDGGETKVYKENDVLTAPALAGNQITLEIGDEVIAIDGLGISIQWYLNGNEYPVQSTLGAVTGSKSITPTNAGSYWAVVTFSDGTGSASVTTDIIEYNLSSETTYTVTFNDYDNTQIQTYKVMSESRIEPPTLSVPAGYKFYGWNDGISTAPANFPYTVESDKTFKAAYISIAPAVTVDSTTAQIVDSGNVKLSVTATHPAGTNLTYQWFVDDQHIPDANGSTYTATKPGSYYAMVWYDDDTNGHETATSDTISVVQCYTVTASGEPDSAKVFLTGEDDTTYFQDSTGAIVVPAGTYTWTASASRYKTQTGSVAVDGTDDSITYSLETAPSSESVTFVAGYNGAQVTIYHDGTAVKSGTWTVSADLVIGQIYTVECSAEGYETSEMTVTATDGMETIITISMTPVEPDPEPTPDPEPGPEPTPDNPPSSGDDEDLPPIIRPGTSSSSGDDDTVTIVACAAAAVVAALMAVFLIVLYRKD